MKGIEGVINLVGSFLNEGQIENFIPNKNQSPFQFVAKTLMTIGKFFNKANDSLDNIGKEFKMTSITNLIKPLNIDEIFNSSGAAIVFGETAYESHKMSKKLDFALKNNLKPEELITLIEGSNPLFKEKINEGNLIETIKDFNNKLSSEPLDEEEIQQLKSERERLLQKLLLRLKILKEDSIYQAVLHTINATATATILGATISSFVNPKLLLVTPLIIAGSTIAKRLLKDELKTAPL